MSARSQRTLMAFILVALAGGLCRAGNGEREPVQVTVGVFLNSVPAVDLAANSFTFDAYVWFRWDPADWPPTVQPAPVPAVGAVDDVGRGVSEPPADEPVISGPAATFEIIGVGGELTRLPLYSRPGYCCVQVKGERNTLWDVRDFPFDRQRLALVIEDGSYDEREVVYVADAAGSGVSRELSVTGFRLKPVEQRVRSYVYETTFGDPALSHEDSSRYSRYEFAVPMRRESIGLFFKLFSGLLVCSTIAMIALFINATQVDPRFGLCVGALFGIIGSSYLVSSMLPQTSELCYADNLHNAALLTVLAVVIESTVSLSMHLNHGAAGAQRARKIDRITFFVLAAVFLAACLWLTLRAIGQGGLAG